jgi:hypothetical protein
MRLFGQHFYDENGKNAINLYKTILEVWSDIRQNVMKFFKEDLIHDMEASFIDHLSEEIIKESEPLIVILIYDYM